MNCLQILPRFSALSLRSSDSHRRRIFCSYESQFGRDWSTELSLIEFRLTKKADRHRSMSIKAASVPDNDDGKTSEIYSNNMTEAMGAVLTYKHENGINWNFIREDLIVGSCLQTPADVDKLREIGVKTIFCLQQDPDLEYFGVDIGAIQRYAEKCDDIEHLRAEIRDFDMHDLRVRLPAVISKLDKAIARNGGVTYIHCTAGLGRAPAVALACMFWVSGYQLSEAHSMILSKRACFPKVDAIKAATADILIGMKKETVELTWNDAGCSSVAVAGLDVGWGQSIPLRLDGTRGIWVAERELLEGRYEYKYVVDGDWVCSEDKPMTQPNKDGHVNNYVDVVDVDDGERASIRRRMFDDDVDLLPEERRTIKQFLQSYHPGN